MLNKLLCRVNKDEREYYKRLCDNAQPLLIKLQEMLDEDFARLDIINDEDFDNPSWAIKRAYKDGIKKGLTKLKEYGIIGTVK